MMSSTHLVTQETGETADEEASSQAVHILPDGWTDPKVVRIWTPRSARVFGNKPATQATPPP